MELRDIHHAFRDESGHLLPVLAGLDLAAPENQCIAIVRPTGSGKSTLFHILAGLLTPTSGTVFLDGRDITGSPGHVAYTMQKDLLLAWRRVVDNVALGPELAGEPRTGMTASLVLAYAVERNGARSEPPGLSPDPRGRRALRVSMLTSSEGGAGTNADAPRETFTDATRAGANQLGAAPASTTTRSLDSP